MTSSYVPHQTGTEAVAAPPVFDPSTTSPLLADNLFDTAVPRMGEDSAKKEGKFTPLFGFPLPDSSGPKRRNHRRVDGGYLLPDPSSRTHTSRKVAMLLNSTLSQALNDSNSFVKQSKIELLKSISEDYQPMSEITPATPESDVWRIVQVYSNRGFGARTSEFAHALTAWIDAVDFLDFPLGAVPDMFRPHVKAYQSTLLYYGLTFNAKMTNRLVTSAGADGVTPEDGTAVVSRTDRVYTDSAGQTVSLHLTTTSRPENRLASYAANAGFAQQAERILGMSARSGWDFSDLKKSKWSETKFGVLAIARDPNEAGEVSVRILPLDPEKCDDLCQVAKDLYNSDVESSDIVDDSLISPCSPVFDEISSATSVDELRSIFAKYSDKWRPEYTQAGDDVMKTFDSEN